MKKIVAILLSTLPFILIYMISVTGKILSKYTHIPVERIAILNPFGDELEDDDLLKINKDEPTQLDIQIYPRLASNKALEFKCDDKEHLSVDKDNKVTINEYGIYNLIAISKDNFRVYKEINIKVSRDDIERIEVDTNKVELYVEEEKVINATIHSKETLPENRKIVWSSENENVAIVDQNGKIKAVGEGTTKIIVKSNYRPNVKNEIEVIVHKIDLDKRPIYFDCDSTVLDVTSNEFDLSTITVINVEKGKYDSLQYQILSNRDAVLSECITNGVLKNSIIKFDTTKLNKRIKIKASIRLENGEIKSDEIFIRFSKGEN